MNDQKPTKTPKPNALIFRSPIPGNEGNPEDIERKDGGWLFTDPVTSQRMWAPDSNVIAVKFA